MQVYAMIESMLPDRPDARAVVLSTVVWEQHVQEQADDLIRDEGMRPEDITFWIEGLRVLHDPDLEPGNIEFVSWPDKLELEG